MPFEPPLSLIYTCITGKARAINISSNCVKPCNSLGTGDGIIEFSVENFFGVLLSLVQREQRGSCLQRPSFLANATMINSVFYTVVKFPHILTANGWE